MLKFPLNVLGLLCLVTVQPCSAYAQVNGQCGSANGTAPDSLLTTSNDTLCDSGVVTNFSGSGPWTWSCQGSGGGATASCSALANTANTCLPSTMPSRDTLLSSPRNVFALYFGDYFPISRDNLTASADGYNTDWLLATPTDQTWQPYGGFLRTRPLPVSPGPASLYRVMNFARDVRMALARGITGFAYEIGQASCPFQGGAGCLESLNELLAAAQSVDPRFKIMVVPDAHLGVDTISSIVTAVYNNPSIYKYNNKMVIAPWWDIGTTTIDWVTMKQNLQSNGTPIFFMPIDTSSANWSAQQAATDGWGLFATAVPTEQSANINFGNALRNLGIPYMAGLTPQDYRPKNYIYWESMESVSQPHSPPDSIGLGFINGWQNLISPSPPMATPPWVFIKTWNDFSETTSIQPYTDTSLSGTVGTGFYNLNGYFASWYLTQSQPTITHDVMYYFYKKELSGAIPFAQGAIGAAATTPPGSPTQVALPDYFNASDLIEVVAFLTDPGTIQVSIGDNHYSSDVQAGLQVFQVPLAPGIPTFSLRRGPQTIFSFQGQTTIYDSNKPDKPGLPSGYTDMTYWSGGGSAAGVCQLSIPPESVTSTVVNSNGACGPATGTSVTSAPTSGFCALGTASSVIGTGPFVWSCSDPSSNTTALCSANLTSP